MKSKINIAKKEDKNITGRVHVVKHDKTILRFYNNYINGQPARVEKNMQGIGK